MENGEGVNGWNNELDVVAQLFEYRELYVANTVIRIKFSIEGFIDIPASVIQRAPLYWKKSNSCTL